MTAAAITERLRQALSPTLLQVMDDSHLHAGHTGAREGGHYTVHITAECFTGLARLARHRLVYDSLGPLTALGVHALAIKASSPSES